MSSVHPGPNSNVTVTMSKIRDSKSNGTVGTLLLKYMCVCVHSPLFYFELVFVVTFCVSITGGDY